MDLFEVTEKPPFPLPGSVLGKDRRYFCLSPLGKGTFCGIHKCVDLSYSHTINPTTLGHYEGMGTKIQTMSAQFARTKVRLVAAKVELSNFTNSGVIDSEAMILSYLSNCMDDPTVPKFVDYIKSANVNETALVSSNVDSSSGGKMSAIIMEYLAGEDMHTIRDQHCQSVLAQVNLNQSPVQDPQVSSSLKKSSQKVLSNGRRLSVPDAIYLCADVMLPMIESIHNMGIIHRDIKPSNCVRVKGTKHFRLIDFGLSKSFVVSEDIQAADQTKPWPYPRWMGSYFNRKLKQRQQNSQVSLTEESDATSERLYSSKGCISKERPKADFRGTSMYASLRVHQDRDYGRRDDLWSLMYVFCDFVAGGLPWMYFAAARDRKMCLAVKEWIHGERKYWNDKRSEEVIEECTSSAVTSVSDHLEELLKGADYHTYKFKPNEDSAIKTGYECTKAKIEDESISENKVITKTHRKDTNADDNGESNRNMDDFEQDSLFKAVKEDDSLKPVPDASPLPLASDPHKVECVREIFRHLYTLGYADVPDYSFIRQTLKRFGETFERSQPCPYESYPLIQWETLANKTDKVMGLDVITTKADTVSMFDPTIDLDDVDSLEDIIRNDVGSKNDVLISESEKYTNTMSSEAEDLNRLPLALQLRLAQVEYNACNPSTVPIHIALRDWLALVSSLLNDPWDISNYERKGHRSLDARYRREVFLKILTQSRAAARPFQDFISPHAFYFSDKNKNIESLHEPKRRKLLNSSRMSNGTSNNTDAIDLMETFHKVYRLLHEAIETEYEKKIAPPSAISF